MIEIIRAEDNKVMPWKNGHGSTHEIEISPKDSILAEGAFDYRLSSAKVISAGPFSQFEGFDRWLCVIEGDGLDIDGELFKPFSPFRFQGEDRIYAKPLGVVLDIGLIYRREKFSSEMKAEILPTNKEISRDLLEGIHFIFCARGEVEINNEHLKRGDTLKTTVPMKVIIRSKTEANIVTMSLKLI